MLDEYKQILDKYNFNERRFITHAITKLEEEWNKKNVFMIEAPTGYGKSTITATLALKTYNDYSKLIIALPLRTLLEDQYEKLCKIVDKKVLGKRYMHESSSRYLIKPITLTTIDTLALTMFGLAPEDLSNVVRNFNEWDGTMKGSTGHYLFSWSSITLSDVVLDEVHLLSDSTKSLSFLITLIEHAIMNDQRIVLMSATIPKALKDGLDHSLRRYNDKVEWIRFGDALDNEFINNRKRKRYSIFTKELDSKFDDIVSWIDEGFNNGKKRVLAIFNTISDAVTLYKNIQNRYNNCILLHSRFSEEDRRRKNQLLQNIKSRDDYIIIATQVVEAGIDISSDLLITELAPANSLVQRFGRFLRYNEEEGSSYIWYEPFHGDRYKVYDPELCKKTVEYIKDNDINMHIPIENGYPKLLNYTYDAFDINERRIDEMLITFTNFGNISHAVNLFYELEGSFVRDGMIVPVTLENNNIIIPVSYNNLLSISDNVKGVVKENEIKEIDPNVLHKNTKRFVSYMLKQNIRAFVIDAEYDKDVGLILNG